MKINSLLEAIDQTSDLTQIAYNTVKQIVYAYVDKIEPKIIKLANSEVYVANIKDTDKIRDEIYANDALSSEQESAALDRLDAQIKNNREWLLYRVSNLKKNKPIINTLVTEIEVALQQIARDYVEKQFGKIEEVIPKNSDYLTREELDDMYTKNLYWLKRLTVQIEANNYGGKGQVSGGHFNAYPQASDMNKRASKDFNPRTDVGVIVQIYAMVENIWAAVHPLICNKLIEKYGDYETNHYPENWTGIKSIVSTFVHEVVHLEQRTRLSIQKQADGTTYRTSDHTIIPDPSTARPKLGSMKRDDPTKGSASKNIGKPYWKYRGGRRGYTGYDITSSDKGLDKWGAYLGSVNEIESFAAQTAADIYMQFRDSKYTNRKIVDQGQINRMVDNSIQELRTGNFDNISLNYLLRILPTVKKAKADPNPSPREKQFIKAWNLFLKKTIKHLNSYKKDL